MPIYEGVRWKDMQQYLEIKELAPRKQEKVRM